MEDRVGEDFNAIILSCTKYGFFVELDDLFIEGLVPIATLQDDRYIFRDTDRQIVGTRKGRVFKMGQRVHVLLDRIDRQQRRLQFALLPSDEDIEQRRIAAQARREREPHAVRSSGARTDQPEQVQAKVQDQRSALGNKKSQRASAKRA